MTWLEDVPPLWLGTMLIVIVIWALMNLTNLGLRRQLKHRDEAIAVMSDKLMRLGVKVEVNAAFPFHLRFVETKETKAFRQAYYIGSHWNLERVLEFQARETDDPEKTLAYLKANVEMFKATQAAEIKEGAEEAAIEGGDA